ncbi:MAG: CRISPR-associated protein Cas4 [archaeon GB-1867-005]|nr:CRISPR-associated protein Cas4 [Candidatus Culexmicrobium cathedralense]
MSEYSPYITTVEVKNYALCPMIVYYTHVLHIYEPETEAMKIGREIHDKPPIAPIIPKLKATKILKEIQLESKTLKLRGKLDTIIITKHNEYIPIEVKWSDPTPAGKAQKHHKAQLTAYALLIEENYKTTVKRATIYYARAGKIITINITNTDKKQVKQIINKIHEMIATEKEPKIKPNPKTCTNCGYNQYCREKQQEKRAIVVQ